MEIKTDKLIHVLNKAFLRIRKTGEIGITSFEKKCFDTANKRLGKTQKASSKKLHDAYNTLAVQIILLQTDWEPYWEKVCERTGKESDAYRLAEVKSLSVPPTLYLLA